MLGYQNSELFHRIISAIIDARKTFMYFQKRQTVRKAVRVSEEYWLM